MRKVTTEPVFKQMFLCGSTREQRERSSQREVRLFIYLLIFKDLLNVCCPLGTVLSIRDTKNNECHGLQPQRGDHLEGKRQERQSLHDRAG